MWMKRYGGLSDHDNFRRSHGLSVLMKRYGGLSNHDSVQGLIAVSIDYIRKSVQFQPSFLDEKTMQNAEKATI